MHQDGLVHVSQLANKFVKDPREVVKTGDVVKVRVEEVDVQRKRISLTMRLEAPAAAHQSAEQAPRPARREERKFEDRYERRSANPNSQAAKSERKPDTRSGGHKSAPAAKKPLKESAPAANSAMSDALAAAFAKSRK